MFILEIIKAIILGIVEGITEWLPVSSTGHMILVDEFLKLNVSDSFKEMFFVVIQLGAILAVVLLFWNKMFPFQFKDKSKPVIKAETFSLWFKVVVACIPGAVVTLLFVDYIANHLTSQGKAGIIVPDGVVFNQDKSFVNVRKDLIDRVHPSDLFPDEEEPKTLFDDTLLLFPKIIERNNDLLFFAIFCYIYCI